MPMALTESPPSSKKSAVRSIDSSTQRLGPDALQRGLDPLLPSGRRPVAGAGEPLVDGNGVTPAAGIGRSGSSARSSSDRPNASGAQTDSRAARHVWGGSAVAQAGPVGVHPRGPQLAEREQEGVAVVPVLELMTHQPNGAVLIDHCG